MKNHRSNTSSLLLLALLLLNTSCGGIQTLTIKGASSVLVNSSYQLESEDNWENFKDSIPANLKLIESFLYLDPQNTDLLLSLVKGYAAYSFTVNETLYLEDFLAENDKIQNYTKAVTNLSRAMNYGVRYLKEKGITYKELMGKMNEENGVISFLDDKLSNSVKNIEAIFYIGQALGALVNLQKDKMTMIAQLPLVKALFDWSCSKKPDINQGGCAIFYGTYETSRPKYLGGNPVKGKEHFENAIKEFPDNWLIRTMYTQFYLIPMASEDAYQEQKDFFSVQSENFYKNILWFPGKEVTAEHNNVRLFQAIALKRFNIIKKYEEELF